MNIQTENALKKTVLSSMFIAIGIILPFLTGQIQQIGNMLLPMHLPVFLCGMICGWQYGAAVGAVLPLLRSLIFTMPPLFPTALAMAFELCVYGLVSGIIFNRSKKQGLAATYISLVLAMIAGRIVWGIVQTVLLGINGTAFTWQMFAAGALINAIPGIILQLILIPSIMTVLRVTGALRNVSGASEK